MRIGRTAWLALAAALASGAVLADEPARRPLRMIGEAPAAQSPVPGRFVIDAVVTPGADFQSDIEGWYAGLGPDAAVGSFDGSCVEKRCTIGVDMNGGKLSLVGDFGELAGPVGVRFTFKDEEGKVTQGEATLRPLVGALADLPALAPPNAVDAAELDELLMWNGQNLGFGGHDKGEPPSSFQRSTLADWQTIHQHPATGLIFASELAELRAGAADARRVAGWTSLGDAARGWTAGYPAAVLAHPTRSGAEQRFASADGAATLTIAIVPAMSREDFDAFVEATTADHPNRSSVNYTRVNSDMEISYQEGGRAVVEAYHNRQGGLGRLTYSYPADREDPYGLYASIVQRSFVVSDELKP